VSFFAWDEHDKDKTFHHEQACLKLILQSCAKNDTHPEDYQTSSKILGGVDGALRVTRVAIGTKHLVAFDGGNACRAAETGQHAAQRIAQVEGGLARVIQSTQQSASQAVVVQVALVTTRVEVAVFLQPEGIDGHGGATARGRAAQDTIARGVVDVLSLVGYSCVLLGELVNAVVGSEAVVLLEVQLFSKNEIFQEDSLLAFKTYISFMGAWRNAGSFQPI